MVYVLSKDGQALMPTGNCAKVRVLLKTSKAVIIGRCPFIIKLMYDSTTHTQKVTLGVDAGSGKIGFSGTVPLKVLYEAETELRNDIVKNISTRKEFRKSRRNRKTRYRKPRFDNRKKSDKWLAPSVEQKIETHVTMVKKIHKILPVSKVRVEVASFDIQKIKNPDISGKEYQQGDQLGFWNVREYILWRDGHKCQYCKGKSGCNILNVHHKESRKTGGNSPDNLITLCEYCHKKFHQGLISLPEKLTKRSQSFRDAEFMGIMRWSLYDRLKEIYPDVELTYGYITKNTRIENGLPKEHFIDARCISGNPKAVSDGVVYQYKKVRCHNRQIHKATINKGGTRKKNQVSYKVKGFRLFDKVEYQGKEYFIFGRRSSGYFDIRTLSGEKVNNGSVSYKKLKLIESAKSFLVERRQVYL